jgi:polar amino acid transport system substrate-binding protein
LKHVFLSILLLALWHPASLPALPKDRSGIQAGTTFVVGVVHDPPYIIKEKTGGWAGVNVDLWKGISQELKIDTVFKEMTFPELLEALKNNQIDVSIESFFLMAERIKEMEYSVPFGSTRLAVATLPGRLDHPWLAAIKIIFSWGTLKVVGILFVVLCILGFFFWVAERKSNPEHFGEGFVKGVGAGIYWVGSTLASGVCIGIALKSLPARILGLLWMLSCAVALSALVASLTTSLALNRLMSRTVGENTLRHMRLGGIEASAESPVLKNIGGAYVLYQTEQEALSALLNKEIEGFVYDEVTLHYYMDHDYKGKISVDPTDLKRFAFAFGFPKDSPWRTPINTCLLNFIEKPDWAFLLSRYGLGQNFEEISASSNVRTR